MRPSCCADSSLCSLRPGGPKGPRKSARHPTVDLFGTWPMFVWFNYSKNVQWQPQTTKKKYVILTHKIRLLRTSENHCNIKQPQISPQKKDAFSSRKATVSNSIATTQSITALPGIQQNCMGSPGSSKASSATSQREMKISSLMPHSQLWIWQCKMEHQWLNGPANFASSLLFLYQTIGCWGFSWFWAAIFPGLAVPDNFFHHCHWVEWVKITAQLVVCR